MSVSTAVVLLVTYCVSAEARAGLKDGRCYIACRLFVRSGARQDNNDGGIIMVPLLFVFKRLTRASPPEKGAVLLLLLLL